MIRLGWLVGGVIVGLLISTVLVPPTRKQAQVPTPHDPTTYHTPTGCVHVASTEVPCGSEADSLNLLANK